MAISQLCRYERIKYRHLAPPDNGMPDASILTRVSELQQATRVRDTNAGDWPVTWLAVVV